MRRLPLHLFVVPVLAALLVGFDVFGPFDTRLYDQWMRLHQPSRRLRKSCCCILMVMQSAGTRISSTADRWHSPVSSIA
ncbi:MAG: hypothetical protein KatS3mg127_0573 [Silanimonas sp.]|nr:MAG: hypothetical protein KatS3mg127_0573 [Silanimonas sp.]